MRTWFLATFSCHFVGIRTSCFPSPRPSPLWRGESDLRPRSGNQASDSPPTATTFPSWGEGQGEGKGSKLTQVCPRPPSASSAEKGPTNPPTMKALSSFPTWIRIWLGSSTRLLCGCIIGLAVLAISCATASPPDRRPAANSRATYLGSASCEDCHEKITKEFRDRGPCPAEPRATTRRRRAANLATGRPANISRAAGILLAVSKYPGVQERTRPVQ